MTEIQWGVKYLSDGWVMSTSDRENAERVARSATSRGDRAVVVYRHVIPWTVIETDQAPVLP